MSVAGPIGRDPVRRDPVVALTAELVRIPSHPGLPRQEEAVTLALAAWLRRHGLDPRLVEVAPGRPNLLCTLQGAAPGRHLMLCGHTDTVPLNADGPGFAFAGDVVDGELRGRGSVDMKGAVAAMAVALATLARQGLPAGAVTLAAVVDEEMESIGAEYLVRHQLADLALDGAIVGEPTSNLLCRGHKGLEWLEVELVGRAAHGGTPQAGINAIVAAARFLALVESRLGPVLAGRAHPLLGPPTFNVGTIRGGDQPSTVAGRAVMAVDRRTVPGESYAGVIAELEGLLAEVRRGLPGLTTEVRRMSGGMATMEHLPLYLAADAPLVVAVDAARAAVGLPAAPHGAFPAWTDGALLAAFGGVPTVILGPGDLALAHGPREAVPVAELVAASQLYAAAARAFCAT
jgi:acetylornithine deacetylase/succinyl-diaminopimelate desuccinylase